MKKIIDRDELFEKFDELVELNEENPGAVFELYSDFSDSRDCDICTHFEIQAVTQDDDEIFTETFIIYRTVTFGDEVCAEWIESTYRCKISGYGRGSHVIGVRLVNDKGNQDEQDVVNLLNSLNITFDDVTEEEVFEFAKEFTEDEKRYGRESN